MSCRKRVFSPDSGDEPTKKFLRLVLFRLEMLIGTGRENASLLNGDTFFVSKKFKMDGHASSRLRLR